jgi:predicted DNA binding CopG/RHH family protein
MKKNEKAKPVKRSTVSRGKTYEEIGDFWDTHDLADFADQIRPATFEVHIKKRRFLVAVDPGILREVRRRAATRGLSPESLVNLWLKEKLAG